MDSDCDPAVVADYGQRACSGGWPPGVRASEPAHHGVLPLDQLGRLGPGQPRDPANLPEHRKVFSQERRKLTGIDIHAGPHDGGPCVVASGIRLCPTIPEDLASVGQEVPRRTPVGAAQLPPACRPRPEALVSAESSAARSLLLVTGCERDGVLGLQPRPDEVGELATGDTARAEDPNIRSPEQNLVQELRRRTRCCPPLILQTARGSFPRRCLGRGRDLPDGGEPLTMAVLAAKAPIIAKLTVVTACPGITVGAAAYREQATCAQCGLGRGRRPVLVLVAARTIDGPHRPVREMRMGGHHRLRDGGAALEEVRRNRGAVSSSADGARHARTVGGQVRRHNGPRFRVEDGRVPQHHVAACLLPGTDLRDSVAPGSPARSSSAPRFCWMTLDPAVQVDCVILSDGDATFRPCPRSRAHRTPPPPGRLLVGQLPLRGAQVPSTSPDRAQMWRGCAGPTAPPLSLLAFDGFRRSRRPT